MITHPTAETNRKVEFEIAVARLYVEQCRRDYLAGYCDENRLIAAKRELERLEPVNS